MENLKLYTVDFNAMWPVPSGLIILARNKKEAQKMAEETITHTKPEKITCIRMDKPKVVFYESGNY